jgi:hypothetical protein
MNNITMSEILDDLRVADEALRKFERRYWLASAQFYELYSQGRLDNGEYHDDFAEWAGFYQLKARREQSLRQLSEQRLTQLEDGHDGELIRLEPQEPIIELSA